MLEFSLTEKSGQSLLRLAPTRIYNLGSATRDKRSALAHQEEVADIGVTIAFDRPAPRIYPMDPTIVTTADRIGVLNDQTSGEVEIVLVVTDDLYVGVGSDHTDRILEKTSILWSKQACANVIAPRLWRFAEIADHWDQCRLTMEYDGAPYQDLAVGVFLPPLEILEILKQRLLRMPARDYLVFCGTYVTVDKKIHFGTRWSFAMRDPVLGRAIEHAYTIVNLLDEVRPEHRVPLMAAPSK